MQLKISLFFLAVLIQLISLGQISRGGETENTSANGIINNVHALIIGVSDYKEITPLKYADNDADLILKVVELNFPSSKNNIIQLTNTKANEYSILKGFQQITGKVKENDLVIFYFAGHGDVANINSAPKGYLLAYDASSSREYDLGGSVSFDRIHDSISKMVQKKAKVYMITDACRSGSVINSYGSNVTLEALNTLQEGTTRFISCRKEEASFELDSLQHGAFTYFLVKSIGGHGDTETDQLITVDELDDYLKGNVRKVTSNRQTPQVKGPDDLAEVFKTDPSVIAFLNPETLSNDLAMRGSAASKSAKLIQFENAIIDGNLYGNSSSARFLLDNWTKTKALSASEIEQMKSLLVESLIDRSQENINRFLRGKSVIGSTDDYSGTVKDLKIAAELLGANHFMTKTLNNRANFFEAMEIIRKGNSVDFPKAESLLIALEKADPNSAYIHQGLAMLYIAKNNKEAAENELKKTENKISTWDKPKNTDAYLNILAGKLDRSMLQLKASEDVSSDKSDIFLLRAQMHLTNFDLMEAEKMISKLINSSPGTYQTESAVILGKIEELRGRLKYAEEKYKKELSSNATNSTILLKLADLYRSQNDTLKAKEYYSKVISVDANNLTAKNALAALNKGIVSTSNLNFYNQTEVLAHLSTLEKQQKNEEALMLISKVLEINNWNPEYYYQKGKFLYNLNKKVEATDALKKGISLSPFHFESIRALVYILIEQKKFTEADALIKQHQKYFLSSAKWLTFEYNAYRLMNSKNDLFSLLERAIKLDSFDLEPYRALIKLHIENNDYQNGQRELISLLGIGGDEKDQQAFLNLTDKQVKSEFAKKNYLPLFDGVHILLKEVPLDADYLYMGSTIAYFNKEYKISNEHLKSMAKFIQTLSPGAQLEYNKLKGKVLLETGNFEEAEKAFQLYNMKAGKPCYLGLAMAQFELGKKDSWIVNFKKDIDISEFNEDANLRFQKMLKKAGL
jgi:tetratricopeptide (TPR) repeat protein